VISFLNVTKNKTTLLQSYIVLCDVNVQRNKEKIQSQFHSNNS